MYIRGRTPFFPFLLRLCARKEGEESKEKKEAKKGGEEEEGWDRRRQRILFLFGHGRAMEDEKQKGSFLLIQESPFFLPLKGVCVLFDK